MGDGGKYVAKAVDLGLGRWKEFVDKMTEGLRGEVPVLAPIVDAFKPAYLANAVSCDEDDSTRLEDAFHLAEGMANVENHLEGLRADDAIEGIGGDGVFLRQIGHDGCFGISRHDTKNVTLDDARLAVFEGVRRVTKFEHAAFDIAGVIGEEFLDVVSGDILTAIHAEGTANGLNTAQIAEVDLSQRRPMDVEPPLLLADPPT